MNTERCRYTIHTRVKLGLNKNHSWSGVKKELMMDMTSNVTHYCFHYTKMDTQNRSQCMLTLSN
jgi:hypothetical protein